MFLVGLTGGIGSGKSVVAACFEKLGAGIVDTDHIAHQLTTPQGAAIAPIRATFGDAVFTDTGELNRAALRAQIFQDASQRAQLENILHPLIRIQAQQEISASTAPYVIVVVPLLLERGGWKQDVDRIAVVDCTKAQQIERVMRRSATNLSPLAAPLAQEDVAAIMRTQATRAVRLAAADDVIDNSVTVDTRAELQHLDTQVATLHACYLAYAGGTKDF